MTYRKFNDTEDSRYALVAGVIIVSPSLMMLVPVWWAKLFGVLWCIGSGSFLFYYGVKYQWEYEQSVKGGAE